MSDKVQDLEQDEKLISRFKDELDVRIRQCKTAQETQDCPSCGAKKTEPCGYIAFDKHFGENLPDFWVHVSRRQAVDEAEKKALESML